MEFSCWKPSNCFLLFLGLEQNSHLCGDLSDPVWSSCYLVWPLLYSASFKLFLQTLCSVLLCTHLVSMASYPSPPPYCTLPKGASWPLKAYKANTMYGSHTCSLVIYVPQWTVSSRKESNPSLLLTIITLRFIHKLFSEYSVLFKGLGACHWRKQKPSTSES